MATKKSTRAKKTTKTKKDIRVTAAIEKQKAQNELDIVNHLISNVGTRRLDFIQGEEDPYRDLNSEFHYPDDVSIENYRAMYDREAYARRVVEIYPKESWLVSPKIQDASDSENTAFQKDWDSLPTTYEDKSWSSQPNDNSIWGYLSRTDIHSGIGSYGILLIGLDDGKLLSEPVDGFEEDIPDKPVGKHTVTFMRTYDESLAPIESYETRKDSSRYGEPVYYQLPEATDSKVHWSRVIHVADNLGSSEILGTPRQQPVYNNLLNIRKILGSSAEMYYKGAFPGLSFETHPQLGGDVNIDTDSVKEMIEQYQNSLQRYLVNQGISVKSLAPQVVEPSKQIETQVDAICVQLGCPKRIFLGSERGELSSTQDAIIWQKRVKARREKYLTPDIINPFVDRLIIYGTLSEPTEGYYTIWPEVPTLSVEEQATVTKHRTEAIVKYVQGGGETLINPMDFLVLILGLDEQVAEDILQGQ